VSSDEHNSEIQFGGGCYGRYDKFIELLTKKLIPLFISSVNKKKLSKVKMTKNKILLAGATGYLGKHITQELLSRNLKQK